MHKSSLENVYVSHGHIKKESIPLCFRGSRRRQPIIISFTKKWRRKAFLPNCGNSASHSRTLRASEEDLMTGSLRKQSNSSSSFSSLSSLVVAVHSPPSSFVTSSIILDPMPSRQVDVFATLPCKLISIVIYCRILNTFYQTICHLSA